MVFARVERLLVVDFPNPYQEPIGRIVRHKGASKIGNNLPEGANSLRRAVGRAEALFFGECQAARVIETACKHPILRISPGGGRKRIYIPRKAENRR